MNLTGKDLKAYRELQGLSQRQFAKAYNLNRSTLAKYEWRNTNLPVWIIHKLMNFDPAFKWACDHERKKHLENHYNIENKKSWLSRFIGWLIGY